MHTYSDRAADLAQSLVNLHRTLAVAAEDDLRVGAPLLELLRSGNHVFRSAAAEVG